MSLARALNFWMSRSSFTALYFMVVISVCNLRQYAQQFWERQKQKHNPNDAEAIRVVERGDDGVSWLANLYPYKLPQPYNRVVELVEFQSSDELDKLLIHDYMINDEWMKQRGLVPDPKTRRLGDMARIALERDYFRKGHYDTQITLFREWTARSLEGFIADSLPFVEVTWEDELEIVDGWGRLHAMSALVKRGRAFKPFKAFVASQSGLGSAMREDMQNNPASGKF